MANQFFDLLGLQINANIPTYFLAIALLIFIKFIKNESSINRNRMVSIILICIELTIFSSIDKAVGILSEQMHIQAISNGFDTTSAYLQSINLSFNSYNICRYIFATLSYALRIAVLMTSYYLVEKSGNNKKKALISIPGYVTIALFITSSFTKWCFYFDNVNYGYHSGPLHNVLYITAVFYMLHVFFEINKSYENNKKTSLFILLLFLGATIIIVLEANGTIEVTNDIVNPIFLITVSLYYLLMETHVVYEEMEMKEKNLTNSKLAAMTNQIRPHFIFNCISNIIELCDEGSTARKALITFSRYLRININSLDQSNAVPFEKELEYIKNYVYLEQMRYPDGFEMKYDIQTSDFLVPLITVEIYVENAIKHNVGEKDGVVHVELKTYEKDNYVIVEINDDGVGFDTHTLDSSNYVGTNNAKYRLTNIVNANVFVNSKVDEGTNIYIEIPKEAGEH